MEIKHTVNVEELEPVLDSSGKEVVLGSGTYSIVFERDSKDILCHRKCLSINLRTPKVQGCILP